MRFYGKLSFGIFFLFFSFISFSQVTTKEVFPSGDREITLIFDLKLAKDGRAKALLGLNSGVYLWSGAGTSANGNAFEYQPTGQTNFGAAFNPGQMTPLGNDVWSIKLTPRTYFNVPSDKPIAKLGLLLKNTNGSAQTEDFILDLYSGDLAVKWIHPTTDFTVTEKNTDYQIKGIFSDLVTGTLKENGNVVLNLIAVDSLDYSFNSGSVSGNKRTFKLEVSKGANSLLDSLIFQNKPDVIVQNPPENLKPGVNYIGNQVFLDFYAPLKSYVYVMGDFNNWRKSDQYLMKKYPDQDRFWINLGTFPDNNEHLYQYLIDDKITVADPFSNKILDSNNDPYITSTTYPGLIAFPSSAKGSYVSVFQTGQTPFNWTASNFSRPSSDKLSIYELLVRDFTNKGSFQGVIDSLAYLKKLGINAIELMPIMEFSGNDSWGYNPNFMTAVDKAYGPANSLKYLIDQAHLNGIAVILDIVFNQQDAGNPYVQMYWDGAKPSADSPFFNPSATHPYSVFYDMNHESPHTQWFVDSVLEYWLKEFNIDGFRFDLSKGFTQKNSGSDVGAWGNYDASRIQILKRIYDQTRTVDPSAYLILEHFAANNEEFELANHGFLLWANGHFDMSDILQGQAKNYTNIDYKTRGISQPSLVGFIESHDEERLMVRLNNTSLNLSDKINRIKIGASLLFGVPGPKMIWQFGEMAYDIPIDQNGRTGKKPILWNYLSNSDRKSLVNFYSELNRLKSTHTSFNSANYSLQTSTNFKRIIQTQSDTTWFFIANTALDNAYSGLINFPSTGIWYDYFTGDSVEISETTKPINLEKGQFHLLVNQKFSAEINNLSPWPMPNFTVLGIAENPRTLNVYPNPTTGMLNIEWKGDQNPFKDFQLMDISGKKLKEWQFEQIPGQVNTKTIQLHQLPKESFYFISDGKEIIKIKIK